MDDELHARLDDEDATRAYWDNYEPELRWYWAIFKDVHVISRDLLGAEIETEWFDTLGEAQSQFRKFDRDRYRIHGVLRSDDD